MKLLRFDGARQKDPAIGAWLDARPADLGSIARKWFAQMRGCGPDVREMFHNGCPVACVSDAPFGYVNVFKGHVNVGFFHGASLEDPAGLLQGTGKPMRHVKVRPGFALDVPALEALIRASYRDIGARLEASEPIAAAAKPRPLSGGNPQIAKAEGDAPVQAYIAAMPGWKSDVGHRLDALIVRTVPGVRKAVKWNSPFYGVEGQGWFLSFHTFTSYVKVAFFRGASLRPTPPGTSKHKDVRYLDFRVNDPFDEAQVADWIRQAAALPGWVP